MVQQLQPVLADYKVALQSVQAVIDTNGPGYVQLSHAYFPGNAVSVNGSLVEPLQGALNLMVLPLAAGRNVIEIVPMMTDIRRLTFWISGCAILLLLVAMGFDQLSMNAGSLLVIKRVLSAFSRAELEALLSTLRPLRSSQEVVATLDRALSERGLDIFLRRGGAV